MWLIHRLPGRGNDKVRLKYKNLITGNVYDLGGVASDVGDDMVLEWIFNHAEHLTPGDWLRLSDGTLLQYARTRGES